MGKDLLIGIDVGTSVVKSVLFDSVGSELGSAARSNEVLSPHPGWAEQDMDRVWSLVVATLQQLVVAGGVEARQVLAVGVTGQGDGTWLLGLDGLPVRPALTWLDSRSTPIVTKWQASGQAEAAFSITATGLTTASQATQLAWLLEHEPAALKRAKTALHAKDWIFYCLTDQIFTDDTDGGYSFFDVESRTYSEELLQILELNGIRNLLATPRPCYRNRAALKAEVAGEVGLREGTPIVAGPFDCGATALGVGAVHPGDACSVLGTAGIHQLVLEKPRRHPRGLGHTFCHGPRRWMRLLPTMSCTPNLDWILEELFQDAKQSAAQEGVSWYDYVEGDVRKIPTGSEGLIYHPYIDPAGERAPFLEPSAAASFFGLQAGHSRYHLLRALYEGVSLSALDCYVSMNAKPSWIRLAGGGARSRFWCQVMADVIGVPMQICSGSEFGARGAALNAGVAVGLFGSYEEAVVATVCVTNEFIPSDENHRLYQEYYRLYRALRESYLPHWQARQEMTTLHEPDRSGGHSQGGTAAVGDCEEGRSHC